MLAAKAEQFFCQRLRSQKAARRPEQHAPNTFTFVSHYNRLLTEHAAASVVRAVQHIFGVFKIGKLRREGSALSRSVNENA